MSGVCIRVIELTWQANGVVLGDPAAPIVLGMPAHFGSVMKEIKILAHFGSFLAFCDTGLWARKTPRCPLPAKFVKNWVANAGAGRTAPMSRQRQNTIELAAIPPKAPGCKIPWRRGKGRWWDREVLLGSSSSQQPPQSPQQPPPKARKPRKPRSLLSNILESDFAEMQTEKGLFAGAARISAK